MSTSTGKIGRLSAESRGKINLLIRDNRPADEVIALAKTLGAPGVSPQNVSAWKNHGYQEWLRRQERLDEMAGRREFAVELASRAGADKDGGLQLASNAAATLGVDIIQAAIEDFNVLGLKELLAARPEKFLGLIDALAALRKGDQQFVRLQMSFEEYRGKVRAKAEELEALASGKGAASKDEIRAIAKELYGV